MEDFDAPDTPEMTQIMSATGQSFRRQLADSIFGQYVHVEAPSGRHFEGTLEPSRLKNDTCYFVTPRNCPVAAPLRQRLWLHWTGLPPGMMNPREQHLEVVTDVWRLLLEPLAGALVKNFDLNLSEEYVNTTPLFQIYTHKSGRSLEWCARLDCVMGIIDLGDLWLEWRNQEDHCELAILSKVGAN